MKLETIVAGVDFGQPSHDALSWSLRHMAPNAEYVLVHAMELPIPPAFLGESPEQHVVADEMKKGILDDAATFQANFPDARIQVRVPIGDAAPEIAAAAEATGADLALVGPHRSRGGVTELGPSTAERILSDANIPVLLYAGAPEGAPHRILAAVDDSPSAGPVLAWAAALGRTMGVPVRALHCFDERLLTTWDASGADAELDVTDVRALEGATVWLSTHMEEHGLPVTQDTLTITVGIPGEEVSAAAAEPGALVVIGCQRHSVAERMFLGTVAGEVVRTARTPVLLVPGAADG